MSVRRTSLAWLMLVLGPPLAIYVWLWIGYTWFHFNQGPPGLPIWVHFVPPMVVAAVASLLLPIRSGWLRGVATVTCSLITGALTVPYWIILACGGFGDCI